MEDIHTGQFKRRKEFIISIVLQDKFKEAVTPELYKRIFVVRYENQPNLTEFYLDFVDKNNMGEFICSFEDVLTPPAASEDDATPFRPHFLVELPDGVTVPGI